MSFSRRTLSLVTVALVLAALSAGVWLRLSGEGEAEGSEAPGGAAAREALDALPASGTEAFSTAVPQPVTGAEVARDTLWITAFIRRPSWLEFGEIEPARKAPSFAPDSRAAAPATKRPPAPPRPAR